MNRGSRDDRVAAEDLAEASMRPRFMNRGSPWMRHAADITYPASMRPRFMNRGSVGGYWIAAMLPPLQ